MSSLDVFPGYLPRISPLDIFPGCLPWISPLDVFPGYLPGPPLVLQRSRQAPQESSRYARGPNPQPPAQGRLDLYYTSPYVRCRGLVRMG